MRSRRSRISLTCRVLPVGLNMIRCIFICSDLFLSYGHFDYSISLPLKEFAGFRYPLQRETAVDERCGVHLLPSLPDELQDFLAVTSILISCIASEVFAVHLGAEAVPAAHHKGCNGYDGIWTGRTLPGRHPGKCPSPPATSCTRSAPPWSPVCTTKPEHSSGAAAVHRGGNAFLTEARRSADCSGTMMRLGCPPVIKCLFLQTG